MEIDSTTENSIWLFDYGLMEDISAIPDGDLPAAPPVTACFSWPSQEINSCSNVRCTPNSPSCSNTLVFGLIKKRRSENQYALTSIAPARYWMIKIVGVSWPEYLSA